MNFHELPLPVPKRLSASSSLRPFPIDCIPEMSDDKQFTGIFNGLSVEIFDSDAVKHIYANGCFGLSTKTKNVPLSLYTFPQVQYLKQTQYEQKLAWNTKFINQNPNLVMVNLLQSGEETETNSEQPKEYSVETKTKETIETTIVQSDKLIDETVDNILETDHSMKNENDEPITSIENSKIETEKKEVVLNLVADPFPIEENLALFPEEALFLHFSLRCLKVMNFDQTHTLTTDELLDKFCNMNPKFIERFIVYHYYRSKNWVVKGGLKFGGDFLLYYKGPSYYHATYVVLVNDNEVEMNLLDMQSNYRVSDSTKKDLIIATVIRPTGLEYSNRTECLNRLKEFKITEVIPKRFTLNQLNRDNY